MQGVPRIAESSQYAIGSGLAARLDGRMERTATSPVVLRAAFARDRRLGHGGGRGQRRHVKRLDWSLDYGRTADGLRTQEGQLP